MAASDVLNDPAARGRLSSLQWDYNYPDAVPPMIAMTQARDGSVFRRRTLARGHVFSLTWAKRPQLVADRLRQWEAKFEDDFFTIFDAKRQRYYTGAFTGPLQYNTVGNQQVTIQGQFAEVPGVAMYAYPDNWDRDAAIFDARNSQGEDRVALYGAWAWTADAAHTHGGSAYRSSTVDDYAEWLYCGYGYTVWSGLIAGGGHLEVTLEETPGNWRAPITVNLAGDAGSARLLSVTDVALGLHRVKLRCVDGTVQADALEVMR